MGDEEKKLLKSTDPSDAEETSTESQVAVTERRKRLLSRNVPLGTLLLEKIGVCNCYPRTGYRTLIYVLTFCCYASYHLSRKPFSVVKYVLCPDCANASSNISSFYIIEPGKLYNNSDSTSPPGWAPFNDGHGKELLGSVDYSFLFAYAVAMFFSGIIADRVNLRYFLTFGMLGSGISVALVGLAYYAKIHNIAYFIVMQVLGGVLQSTGWPGVVAVMSHWFGKQRRGFIMGIWNAHTSVGNILGTVIPSFWANTPSSPWGLSFFVPALIIATMGVIAFLFLVPDPTDVGLLPPVHHLEENKAPVTTATSSADNTPKQEEKKREAEKTERDALIESGVRVHLQSEKEEGEGKEKREGAPRKEKKRAVGFFRALTIPGVIEFSLALFFNKLVSYTFLFWLPLYVKTSLSYLSAEQADWLSTVFDVGGILGAIIAGLVSDFLDARAFTCVIMLYLAVPFLFILRFFGAQQLWSSIVLLIVCGALVNGPYGLITTAVSSDLGTHRRLKQNQNAKATVTAIIDGTGSLGAAFGPLLAGVISESGWDNVFYFLMASCLVSALLLSRLVVWEVIRWLKKLGCLRLQSRVQFGRDLSRETTEDVELREIELEES